MTDLRHELSLWCQSYVTAFSAYDAPAISAHWRFPALIVQGERVLTFKSSEHFNMNTDALLGFYKTQNVASAKRTLLDCLSMGPDTASMTVADRMLTPEGIVIVEWKAAYVLSRLSDGWKAVMAVADGEVNAWAARGTPLGS